MTAEVSPMFPTGDQADETVRTTVRALIKGRELTVEQVAVMAGMNRSKLYRRLNGTGSQQAFTAGEVSLLARILRVTVAQIYDGLGGTFLPPTQPADINEVRRLQQLPRMDSNHQPSGYGARAA